MTLPRILLSAAFVAAASAAHAQVNIWTSGPITVFGSSPSGPLPNSTAVATFHQGYQPNGDRNPRYLDNLYLTDVRYTSTLEWGFFPGSMQAGHAIFKSTAIVPSASSYTPTPTSTRSEVVARWSYTHNGKRRWYAISVFIPDSWPFVQHDVVVGQLHTQQPGTITVSPPVAVVLHDKYLNLTLQTSELSNDPNVASHIEKNTSSTQTIRLGRIDDKSARDKWYCFVMQADWSNTPGLGGFKMWMNGVLKYDAINAMNSYQSDGGNYAKTGAYLTSLQDLTPGTPYTMYNDYIYLADANTTSENDLYNLTPCGRTGSVAVVQSGLTFNRFTSQYTGTVSLTNRSGYPMTKPLQFMLPGLPAGVTLANKTGDLGGAPYVTLPNATLEPGASATVTTTFDNPGKAAIGYTPVLYTGSY